MNYTIEQQLIEIGVLPQRFLEELELQVSNKTTQTADQFVDPRDENGEVPF